MAPNLAHRAGKVATLLAEVGVVLSANGSCPSPLPGPWGCRGGKDRRGTVGTRGRRRNRSSYRQNFGAEKQGGAKEDRQPHGRTMRGRRLTCPDFGGLFLAFRWINLPPATAATREAGNCDRNGLRHSRSLPSMRVQRFTKQMEIDAMLSAC